MTPTAQGFYVLLRSKGWVPAIGVPCVHLSGKWASYAVLTRDFAYIDKHGAWHIAKAGLLFDGLTIPRILWPCAGNPWGEFLPGGVIHDHKSAVAEACQPGSERDRLRYEADCLFREMLEFMEAHRPVPTIWYGCVRAGAMGAFRYRAACPDYITQTDQYFTYHGVDPSIIDVVLERYVVPATEAV